MKPWVFTDKNKMSSFRSGTNSASIGALAFGVYRPYGAQKKCVSMLNPGLAPWAMQEYRPWRLLHNTALAALLLTFRPRHLQE